MGTSVIEKILGNNILFKTYLQDTINLTKSINIKNDNEAKLYNEYVKHAYPNHSINLSDRTTWRYYKHLMGEYHEVDKSIYITSLDNGERINLTRENMSIHNRTRKELLKFGLFYKQLVDLYPEQELYIKSVICEKQYESIEDIVDLSDFNIVSYNKDLIEDNESDLIYDLQEAIDNYKNIRLIPYYMLSDNLFLASQYHVLYNFILMKILAIRLKNDKTFKAHTFHIRNFLASHHYLNEFYPYLTKKQALFLYRNLLYLDNHNGLNRIFDILIEKLFTERNISIVNYIYNQENDVDEHNYIKYRFKQKLLNKTSLVHSTNDFSLEEIKDREIKLNSGNYKELTYNFKNIDLKFKNSLFNTLLTKDLETIIFDNTDTVRYKFIPMLIDYWAYFLKINKMNYFVTITDSINNNEVNLTTKDLFKLFLIILFKINNIELNEFPSYPIRCVFKENIPSLQELINICYKKEYWYDDTLRDIINSIETITNTISSYNYIQTSLQFKNYIFSIYKLNIGLWLLLSNYSDKDTNGQFEYMIEKMCKFDTYSHGNDNETVNEFLSRIGMNDLMSYNLDTLKLLSYSILNNLTDNGLYFIDSYKNIQKALVEVFKKFNSYTVQLINNYYSNSPLLTGHKDVRYSVNKNIHIKLYHYDYYRLNTEMNYNIKLKKQIEFRENINDNFSYLTKCNFNSASKLNFISNNVSRINILFSNRILNDTGTSTWVVNQPIDDHLLFLALNL